MKFNKLRNKLFYILFNNLLLNPLKFLSHINNLIPYKIIKSHRPNKSEFLAIYDLEFNSPSWNFLDFLLACHFYANKFSYKSAILVIISDNRRDEDKWKVLHKSYKPGELESRSTNLFMQLVDLYPLFSNRIIIKDRKYLNKLYPFYNTYPADYKISQKYSFYDDLLDNLKKFPAPNASLSKFQSDNFNLRLRNNNPKKLLIVTITIRESQFDQVRNSKIEDWLEFSNQLIKHSYFPILIPDTDSLQSKWIYDNISLTSLGIQASLNIPFRYYLYKSAALNLLVGNGPIKLVLFEQDIPYIIYKVVAPGSYTTPTTLTDKEAGWTTTYSKKLVENNGSNLQNPYHSRIIEKKKYFWSSDKQVLSTLEDNLDNIKLVFNEYARNNNLTPIE